MNSISLNNNLKGILNYNMSKPKTALVYPQVSFEEWAKLYSLSTEPKPCTRCGRLQFPTIPFAFENWRGLQAEIHDCGATQQLSVAREVGSS